MITEKVLIMIFFFNFIIENNLQGEFSLEKLKHVLVELKLLSSDSSLQIPGVTPVSGSTIGSFTIPFLLY